MSTQKDIEQRRKKIQVLLFKGWHITKIATHLGVSDQTVYDDLQELNGRYKKLVTTNPDYLNRQLEHVFKFIERYEYVLSRFYDIADSDEEEIKVRDKLVALNSIVTTLEKEARILKLISPDTKYIQNNFVHVDQLQPIFNQVTMLIKDYVPEDKQIEALQRLKGIDIHEEKT